MCTSREDVSRASEEASCRVAERASVLIRAANQENLSPYEASTRLLRSGAIAQPRHALIGQQHRPIKSAPLSSLHPNNYIGNKNKFGQGTTGEVYRRIELYGRNLMSRKMNEETGLDVDKFDYLLSVWTVIR